MIGPDGGKLFLKSARMTGTRAVLGEVQPGQSVVIAEGFATAATMREATGLTVIVAFDSGNLMAVAQAYRALDAARGIVIAADNDHHLPCREPPLPNMGEVKAAAAAQVIGALVLQPAFAASDDGTDWNDFAAQHGKAAVRALAQAELRKLGSELLTWRARLPLKPHLPGQRGMQLARRSVAVLRQRPIKPLHRTPRAAGKTVRQDRRYEATCRKWPCQQRLLPQPGSDQVG